MSILGSYQNGNYKVTLLSDGTKIRENDLDFFEPEFPESMDIKITNKCDMGCPFCHEDSRKNGEHGDILNLPFLDSIHPFTELAIGGGNPLEHPDLVAFLEELKSRSLIANVTVNQKHFLENEKLLSDLVSEGLIYGLGISYTGGDFDDTQELVSMVKKYKNAVIHVINGIVSVQELAWLSYNNLKILILGYKEFRRGVRYHSNDTSGVDKKKMEVYQWLRYIVENQWFNAVSFDNLAISQLDVRRLMSDKEWSEFFMGDDGREGNLTSASMYIDAVSKKFARNSCCLKRYDITDNLTEMFQLLRAKE